MALEPIDGSVYVAETLMPLFKNCKDSITGYGNEKDFIILIGNTPIMYHSIEIHRLRGYRHYSFKVLYDAKIWYIMHEHEEEFKRIL